MGPRDWLDPNPSVRPPGATFQTATTPTSILLVDDDPEYLTLVDRVIGEDEGLEITTASAPTDALSRVHDVECVVSAHAMEPTTGLELLAEIRTREPTLPFVLHTNAALDAVHDTLLAHEGTDYLQKGGPEAVELLPRRIQAMVERRRSSVLLERTLAGLDVVRDGVAVVGPDGVVQFANRQYLARFGTDLAAAVGSNWREWFLDAEVDRIETEAIPTTEEGWRWTGTCVCRRADGDSFTAQLSLVGLEDGCLVFVVQGTSHDEHEARDDEAGDDEAGDDDVADDNGETDAVDR